jgi:hypothetical protein
VDIGDEADPAGVALDARVMEGAGDAVPFSVVRTGLALPLMGC